MCCKAFMCYCNKGLTSIFQHKSICVMLLKVDNRERTIIPALTKACEAIHGVIVNVESMPIGDAGIYSDDGKEMILFER